MKATSGLHTIQDYIRFGMSEFRRHGLHFGHGTDNAMDEAAWLVLHTLSLPLDLDRSWWNCRLTEFERGQVLTILQERVTSRKPAAYLTQEAWFMGIPFYVDERVLVPRSPIAELLSNALVPWCEPERVERVLDLCTGSGCIGIAAGCVFPSAEIWLADVSADALEVARINVEGHGFAQRTHLVQSDVFADLDPSVAFDLILCNPPYVDAQEMAQLPLEYRREPSLGLAAGDDGLEIVRRILADAADYLQPEGVLVVEVGNSQSALMAAYPDLPCTWLEFEQGGQGVFLLTREQLLGFSHKVKG